MKVLAEPGIMTKPTPLNDDDDDDDGNDDEDDHNDDKVINYIMTGP